MKFVKFSAAYQSAKDLLRGFEGDKDSFPGLTAHDRAYVLPVDWQGEEYTAIIRAWRLHEHESSPIPVMIWHWHWRRAQEVDLSKACTRSACGRRGDQARRTLLDRGQDRRASAEHLPSLFRRG